RPGPPSPPDPGGDRRRDGHASRRHRVRHRLSHAGRLRGSRLRARRGSRGCPPPGDRTAGIGHGQPGHQPGHGPRAQRPGSDRDRETGRQPTGAVRDGRPAMKRSLVTGMVVGTVASALAISAVSLSALSGTYTWRNAQIVGGGFVPSIIYNQTQPDLVYARTDIGGAYRRDPLTQRWVP